MHSILDIMDYTKTNNLTDLFLFIDFEKAKVTLVIMAYLHLLPS